MELNSCYWYRITCAECGSFNAADMRQIINEDEERPVKCPMCDNYALIIFVGQGRTSKPVPHIERQSGTWDWNNNNRGPNARI